MTLLQLRVLLTVADLGGFTLAAARLGMSQPAVSRAVAALEAELGATLLTRRREGITLTEPGRHAVARARAALREVELLRTEVAVAHGQVTGTVRLACPPTVTGALLAPGLRTFADRYPQVRVQLSEGSDAEVRGRLDEGSADVGVVVLPAPGLRTVPLSSHRMVAVVPAGHALAGEASVGFGSLAGEPFILPTGGCDRVVVAAARRAGVDLDVAFEARELAAVLEMVGVGLGVSVVPVLGVVPGLGVGPEPGLATRPGAVVVRPLAEPLTLRLGLAVAGDRPGPAVTAFVAHMTEAPGPVDAGSVDAGPMDAGPMDAGPMDAGPMDAGPMDAGPDAASGAATGRR